MIETTAISIEEYLATLRKLEASFERRLLAFKNSARGGHEACTRGGRLRKLDKASFERRPRTFKNSVRGGHLRKLEETSFECRPRSLKTARKEGAMCKPEEVVCAS